MKHIFEAFDRTTHIAINFKFNEDQLLPKYRMFNEIV